MPQENFKVFHTNIPPKEYFQICFPGSVNPKSGEKVLEMIGGHEEVKRTMRYCTMDGFSSIKLQLGPNANGPTLHGTTLPTKSLWLKLKTKRRKEGNTMSENRYVSGIFVQGIITASAIFKDPADICFFPVANAKKFDTTQFFHHSNGAENQFNPILTSKCARVRASVNGSLNRSANVHKSYISSSKTNLTQGCEMYLPPPLFFREIKEGVTSWFYHMLSDLPADQPRESKCTVSLYKKMRFFELNMDSKNLKICPKNEHQPLVLIWQASSPFYENQIYPQKNVCSKSACLITRRYLIFDRDRKNEEIIIPSFPPSFGAGMFNLEKNDRWIATLRYLFDKRPIWSISSLLATVEGNTEAEVSFRHYIGCVAYKITGTSAFTRMWIRLGYNPFCLTKKICGTDELKAISMLQPLFFSMPKDMRREIRRMFPSFGRRGHYLPHGFRRTPHVTEGNKISSVIRKNGTEKPPFFTQNIEKMPYSSIADIERCKQTVEELFDDLLLSGSFARSFYPEDLVCERLHTVIKSQIPEKLDTTLGLILIHTRRTVQSILVDELGSYLRTKFPSLFTGINGGGFVINCDGQANLEEEEAGESESGEYDIRSSDSCFDFSDEEEIST